MSERKKFFILVILLVASIVLLTHVNQSTSSRFIPFHRP